MSRWAQAAVRHVEARGTHGPAVDRSLRITLNFHPDRETGGVTVLEALAAGTYRSQFETGTSNGGLTAHPGGARWQWERTLFGGIYDDAPTSERPKYGALDHRRRPLGGAPRFGSAHLRLREHVLDRATFCYPDSAFDPAHVGTAGHAGGLIALADADERDLDPDDESRDPLDLYVEAQVHGRIVLADDVEALVLDPCFRNTTIHEQATRLGLPLEWHPGRVLTLDVLDAHVDYRGPEPVRIGHDIAREGRIDARLIGDAVRANRYTTQPLKQLWHLTAQWGRPRTPADR